MDGDFIGASFCSLVAGHNCCGNWNGNVNSRACKLLLGYHIGCCRRSAALDNFPILGHSYQPEYTERYVRSAKHKGDKRIVERMDIVDILYEIYKKIMYN